MSVFLILLVVVCALGLIAGLGLAFGLFRIEKQEADEEDPAETEAYPFYPSAADLESLQAGRGDPADPSLEENSHDLFDYFAGEEEQGADAQQNDSSHSAYADEESQELFFDKLCECKTGRGFLSDCQKALHIAGQEKEKVALLYFDFDRFRFLNSLKGQSTGDYALTRMAQELRTLFPSSALYTRVSADHFLVITPIDGEGDVQEYVEQLRRVNERIREDLAIKSGLRLSVGAAFSKEARDYDVSLLMQRANVARHCIKLSKSESYGAFDESMLSTFLYGDSALEDYRENQYGGEFNVYLQPIADLDKGKIAGGDALARWVCEEDSYREVVLTPDNGRLPSSSEKLIYQMCRWLGRWHKADKMPVRIFVHIPAVLLFKEDVDAFLAQCFHDFQIEADSLVAQVDVAAIRMDWPLAALQMKKLRDVGALLAVTGIDRGYTTLETLADLPVQYVKLQAGFIHNMERSKERAEDVRRIIQSAKQYGYLTIFEGVNNQEHASLLKKAGANLIQGRYAGFTSQPDDFSRNLSEYLFKQQSSLNSTTILDDRSLSQGDFQVY